MTARPTPSSTWSTACCAPTTPTILSVELWDSRADASAPDESRGEFAKFCPPTVANGKVYFPAWHQGAEAPGSVIVYGLSSP